MTSGKTLSYAHTPRPAVPYSYTTIIDKFNRYVQTFPEKEMQVCYEGPDKRTSKTFQEFDKESNQIAKHFVKQGIDKGVIGILGKNSFGFTTGVLSIMKAGCAYLNLVIGQTDGGDVVSAMTEANCVGLIADCGDDNEFKDYVHRLINNYNAKYKLEVVLMNTTERSDSFVSYASIAECDLNDVNLPYVYPECPLLISTTSGSTGKPKLVLWRHFQAINNAGFVPILHNEINFNDRPFTWGMGMPLHEIMNGWTRIFTKHMFPLTAKKDTEKELWELMKTEKCTRASFMPHTLKDLTKYVQNVDSSDTYRLSNIFTSGQIMDNTIAPCVGRICNQLMVMYGSTEQAALAIHVLVKTGTEDNSLQTGFVGKPFPGIEVSIRDLVGPNKDNIVERGTIGLITTRNNMRFSEYVGRDEKDMPDTFKGDGWISMGDMGFLDNDNNLIVVGRVKDVICRGTMKILPSNVESVIEKLPDVKQAVVISVPDERFREEVCACVVFEHGCAIPNKDIEEHCEENFKLGKSINGLGRTPKYFLQFDSFPVLAGSGKLDRRSLRELAISKLGLCLKT